MNENQFATFDEALDALDRAYDMPTKPSSKKLPENHVFDENMSVKWNKDQVKQHNEARQMQVSELNKERNLAINKATESVVHLIDEYFSGKINEAQAQLIWNYAVEKGHSGGKYEIVAQMQGLLDLFSDFLEKAGERQ